MGEATVVWFRDDLRIADNPALRAAIDRGKPVVGLYVLDEESAGIRPLGAAAKWWLHGSLESLRDRLRERGSDLLLQRGRAEDVVPAVVSDTGASAVLWNRRYGSGEREVDTRLKASLRERGVEVQSFAGSLLFEPWTVRTGAGDPYSVFTPFWRACLKLPAPRAALPDIARFDGPPASFASDDLGTWGLRPDSPDWAGGLREAWEPGEPAARARLREFLSEDAADYDDARDRPDADATSHLSPRLRWGEISPHTVWHETIARFDKLSDRVGGLGDRVGGLSDRVGGLGDRVGGLSDRDSRPSDGAGTGRFLTELGWREFAWHTLFAFPRLATDNWRRTFDAFPWPHADPAHLRAWQRGRTGIPLVDAGMRELWHTGTMHNRVRMVVASFLTKNLLIDWRRGEEWFWDTLVDADAASNPFNWQWVAGSGADAAPYFRIFNPETQAAKFDPRGGYVRRWAPEHFGDDPPEPIVDLGATRKRALEAYETVKNAAPRA